MPPAALESVLVRCELTRDKILAHLTVDDLRRLMAVNRALRATSGEELNRRTREASRHTEAQSYETPLRLQRYHPSKLQRHLGGATRPTRRQSLAYGHLQTYMWLDAAQRKLGMPTHQSARAHFLRACAHGYLSIAQWLSTTYGLTRADLQVGRALSSAGARGHLDVMRWLHATYGMTREDARAGWALASASAHGRLDAMRWLHATYGMTREDACAAPRKGGAPFHMACVRGHLEAAEWLRSTYALDVQYVRDTHVYEYVCKRGQLRAAAWLQATYALTREDARRAFFKACQNAHLMLATWLHATHDMDRETALWVINAEKYDPKNITNYLRLLRWLCNTFSVLGTELRSVGSLLLRYACMTGSVKAARWIHGAIPQPCDVDHHAFVNACMAGHLRLARWLHITYSLERKDVQKWGCAAFVMACGKGRLAVAKWLHETFNLTRRDACCNWNHALRLVSTNGHIGVAMWLHKTFKLKKKDARAMYNESIVVACKYGHLAMAQWLYLTFNMKSSDLTKAKSQSFNKSAFKEACLNGHLEVAQWIHTLCAAARGVDEALLAAVSAKGFLCVAKWLHSQQ